jgi:hypothetical protein
MSLTSDSTEEEWRRAIEERRRGRVNSRISNNTTSTTSAYTSGTTTSTEESPPLNSIEYNKMLAKQAGLEASIYANQLSEQKSAKKQSDINRYMRSGKASPIDRNRFMSIYNEDIQDEIRNTRGPTPPMVIPRPNKERSHPTHLFGGRTKRRSRKGKKAKKGKYTRKSKKMKRNNKSRRK